MKLSSGTGISYTKYLNNVADFVSWIDVLIVLCTEPSLTADSSLISCIYCTYLTSGYPVYWGVPAANSSN